MYNYWCKNRVYKKYNEDGNWEMTIRECDTCDAKGNFQLNEKFESNELECKHGNEEVKLMGETMVGGNFIKMTKEQIKADRQKRSTDHFKREIFPELPADEQIHFTKKYDDLKPTISKKTLDKLQDKKLNYKAKK